MEGAVPEFVREKHQKYLEELDKTKDAEAIGFHQNEHLKLLGGYWCVGALCLLKKLYVDRKEEIVRFVLACQDSVSGGFGGSVGHDAHVTCSLYALLVLAMFDALDEFGQERMDKLADYMASL